MNTEKNKNFPLVSVIMNCYNGEKFLKEAIESVFSQTYKNWEIIFWDNQSTDQSSAIAESFGKPLYYFKGDKFLPLGAARTEAIKKAHGEYIAFLDCDDIWLPEKLEKQMEILKTKPDIDFIYSNFYNLYTSDNKKILVLKGKQPEGNVFEAFLYKYSVDLNTVIVSKRALDSLETLFDEKLNLVEEYDLFMRLLYNHQAAYLNEPTSIYRIHSNMTSFKLKDNWPEEMEYVLEKLKKIDDNVRIKYSKSLIYVQMKIEYLRAKICFTRGDMKNTRRYIWPYLLGDFKHIILYFLTFVPPSILQKLNLSSRSII